MKNLVERCLPHSAKLAVAISAICFCAFQCGAFRCEAQSSQIKRIVIIVQESRSFDTMFGQFPGANGATTGNYLGQTVALKEAPFSSQALPDGTTVLLANGQKVFPCFTIPTLPGELSDAAVTWQYYSAPQGQPGYIWSTLDAISGIRNSSLWTTNVLPVNQFVSNVQNGTLASVVWVTPPTADSDSPPANVCVGQNWVVRQINAIMQSPEWASTAISWLGPTTAATTTTFLRHRWIHSD